MLHLFENVRAPRRSVYVFCGAKTGSVTPGYVSGFSLLNLAPYWAYCSPGADSRSFRVRVESAYTIIYSRAVRLKVCGGTMDPAMQGDKVVMMHVCMAPSILVGARCSQVQCVSVALVLQKHIECY